MYAEIFSDITATTSLNVVLFVLCVAVIDKYD